MFRRDIEREEAKGDATALLTLVRNFLIWIQTLGSDGQRQHAESLLKHVDGSRGRNRSNLSNLSNHSNNSNHSNESDRSSSNISMDNHGDEKHHHHEQDDATTIVVQGLQPSEEAVKSPSGFLYRHTSQEVAMGLTSIAYGDMSQVRPRDLTGKKFSRGTMVEKKMNSPTVMYCIQRFNERVRWVCSVLLWKEIGTPGDRATTISFWIDVAVDCMSLHNFHTTLVIVTALMSPCMHVVTNGMSVVSERSRAKFEDMKAVMSHENNYERYRRVCAECDGRAHVPAFPVLTQDLIRLEDGTKSRHPNNSMLITVSKFNKIHEKIESFCSCRKNPYMINQRVKRGRSSSTMKNKDGNVLSTEPGMQHLLSHWLFPPPDEMELFRTASRVLAEESQNLVKTLDYLGL